MQTLIRHLFPLILALLINLGYGLIKLSYGAGVNIYVPSLAASWAYLLWMLWTKESISWLTKLVGFITVTAIGGYLLSLIFLWDIPTYIITITLLMPLAFSIVCFFVPKQDKAGFTKSESVLLFVGLLLLFMQTTSNVIDQNERDEWVRWNREMLTNIEVQTQLNKDVVAYIEATNPDPVLSIYQDVKSTDALISHIEYMKVLAAEASFHDLNPNPDELLGQEVIDKGGVKTRFFESDEDYSYLDLMKRTNRWQNRLLFKTEGFDDFVSQSLINAHDTGQITIDYTKYQHLIMAFNTLILNLEQVKSYQLSQFEYDVDLPKQFEAVNSREIYQNETFLNKLVEIDLFSTKLVHVLLTVGAVLVSLFLISLFGFEGSYLGRIRKIVFGMLVTFCLALMFFV